MERRDFIAGSAAAFFAALLGRTLRAYGLELPAGGARKAASIGEKGPEARPEITAAVDIIVPADPEVPGDFKGSDYGADRIVAGELGDLGQSAVVLLLNRYASQTAGKSFLECSEEERLEAIREWIRDRDALDAMSKDALSGLLTLAAVGTYEDNPPEMQLELFEKMGWYDPDDPAGTFRTPNEGYSDSYIFPAKLKKGLRP